jgi:CRISPR-associated protein Csm5
MSNTDKLRTWNVTLTTLSPLFIGSGKTLSPYSDFIQEGNNLIYLNQKKIEEAISNKPELIDEYVKEIRRRMNNTKSDASLKDFITTRLKLPLESVTLRKVPLQGNIGKQQLRQFISTAGRPFIPGSTLKGAFRTAVLYDWLINDNNGKKLLEDFIENLEKTDSKNKEEKNEALKKI